MIFHSSVETFYFLLPLAGFIVGLFGTMLGGGGGFFFLPLLTLVFGVPAQTAVITSLVATLPIALVGTSGHYQKGNVNTRMGMVFSVAGIIGAILGATLSSSVSAEQLKVSFGIYSILIAANMLIGSIRNRNIDKDTINENKRIGLQERLKASVFGLSAGMITGSFGTSGTAPILAGLFSMKLSVKKVVGTSLLVVLINTLVAVGAHFFIGKIDLTLVAFLSSGSVLGAFLGPVLLAKTKIGKSESKIKYIYALVIVGIGVAMILG
ncbi:sulfite exporter TauE/SafE family protein [Ancylomarina longa]|uniref:Probable membrane transporter protein n=1 Tax=Ancylomarina longa TaxID=2487017 RepID=A0A434AGC8_9BACT|nr:sulfite exporter TauE/SafE family protein [Ancylomarina longa]RUT73380.1 sulfite exporter TauE/SafE family protein [Ancylomarina longa]